MDVRLREYCDSRYAGSEVCSFKSVSNGDKRRVEEGDDDLRGEVKDSAG